MILCGMETALKWQLPVIPKQIRDFTVGDFDNDGNDEFAAA